MKQLVTLPLNFGRKSPWDHIWGVLYFINLRENKYRDAAITHCINGMFNHLVKDELSTWRVFHRHSLTPWVSKLKIKWQK